MTGDAPAGGDGGVSRTMTGDAPAGAWGGST